MRTRCTVKERKKLCGNSTQLLILSYTFVILVIFRLCRSDILPNGKVILKPFGFSDILFALNSRSEYNLGVVQI